MRILFVSSEYPPITDGIGAYVGSVAPALAARGHSVHVLSCIPGQGSSDEVHEGVQVHRRGEMRLRGFGLVAGSTFIAERVRRAVSCWAECRRLRERFDVIEAPDWMAEGLLVRGAPIVAHLHTPLGLAAIGSAATLTRGIRAGDWLERMAVRRAKMVTAPSRLILDSLRDWVPDGVEARVVPYPVDIARWADVPEITPGSPTVVSVGRLEARKAPEVLVDAIARLPGTEVMFVGRNSDDYEGVPRRVWLERRAAELGVPCRFVDHVARNELPRLYASARVVAIPSMYDNFPMVGLEALASGRPVVCTDATGTAEILEGSAAGAVVPAGDATALADALRSFVSDAGVAADAGREARRLVSEKCSPERIAARREQCYADVIA